MKYSKLLQGCILSAGVIVTAMAATATSTDAAKSTDVQEIKLVAEKGNAVGDGFADLSDIVGYETVKQAAVEEQEKEEPADVQANETIEVMAAEDKAKEDVAFSEPAEAAKPAKAAKPAEAAEPAEAVEPVGVGANQIAAQIGAQASRPVESEGTEEPEKAGQSEEAEEAGQPEEAEEAGQPEEAEEAGQPEEAAETGQPEEAAETEKPSADVQIAANENPDAVDEWADQVMPVVEESLNIRTQPDENADLAGKLYKGSAAQVVEVLDGWTHIVSGEVEGYISNDYCAYAADAQALAAEQCTTYATAMTDGLRVRDEASTESTISTVLEEGDKIKVDTQAEAPEGWVAVVYEDELCYVSAEFVDVKMDIGEAITIEEEMARIAEEEARKAAEEAKKAAASASAQTVQNTASAASADEITLLAAIIQIEAGPTNYDGEVAVGAVVMNRVRSGAYPNSISGVIYQSGQFATGSMNSVIAKGVSSSCYSAAQAAISGVDNTGGALSFRSASSGYAGTVIGGNVFF